VLLVLASAVILGVEYLGTHEQILLYQIWDSPNLVGSGTDIYIPQNSVIQLCLEVVEK
jgi:hypothetical protein